jgi:Flp pilus assembly secretin CpaC
MSLVQASLLPAYSQSSSAIWQQMSAVQPNAKPTPKKQLTKSAVQKKASTKVSSAPSLPDAHAMLFLKSKQSDLAGAVPPAAALTIHPALAEDTIATADVSSTADNGIAALSAPATESAAPALAPAIASAPAATPAPETAAAPEISAAPSAAPEIAAAPAQSSAISDVPVAIPAAAPIGDLVANQSPISSLGSSKQLIAQLAPDQVVAQGDQGGSVTATPIPPVVTGTVDLEEFKTTNVIDLKVSQSRTFKLKNKIVRTSISDPAIAEPVVVSENQIVLLGKTPGSATLVLWDDAGNSVAIDLRVTRDYTQLQSTLREIDPRIIVKAFSVGGSDRVMLLGDVDHPDSVIRAFAAANVFMDDRGMTIQVANSRLIGARIGEQGMGMTQSGGSQTGQLAALSSVDRYTFFPNLNNNISKAQIITSDGGRVTSLVKVRKVPTIVLHVTFMEMNSTAARALGMQLGFGVSARTFAFGVGGNNTALTNANAANALLTGTPGFASTGSAVSVPGSNVPGFIPGAATSPVTFLGSSTANFNNNLGDSVTGTVTGLGLGVLNSAPALVQQAVLFGAPGGASFNANGLGNLFTGTGNLPLNDTTKFSVNPTINGIISHSRARVLAEPTLVCISGERAAFLAGGEIPIIQSIATAGASQQSVTFEPFGLRINMIPMLMENGNLNLEIAPEERIPSFQFGLNVPGSTTVIPGFTTRKEQTIVEMKPGQELFIGGLITANSGRELDKVPILGEIPVLGALYRSKAFSKNESELVVAIRPEIILSGTPGQLKLPEEIGRVEGPRDTNMFQVEPTVVDERHYTSGRDERHQKTSPTLPEGSPIPDNE